MKAARTALLVVSVPGLVVLAAVGGWVLGGRWRRPPSADPLPAGVFCQGTATRAAPLQKIVVIIGENESKDKISTDSSPFEQNVLSQQCGSLDDMHGLTHGSEPNYLGMTSGSYPSWALCDFPPDTSNDDCIDSPSKLIAGPNLFSQLEMKYGAQGWRIYAESMPAPCARTDGTKYKASSGEIRFKYVARHNPAVFYSQLASCGADDIPLGDSQTMTGAFYTDATAGRLPKVSFVIPDNIDNGHDTTLKSYDDFLARMIGFLRTTKDYQRGALDVIVTFDEGTVGSGSHATTGENCLDPQPADSAPSCLIPAWVVGRDVPKLSDTTFESQYTILKSIELWANLPLLGSAADPTTNVLDPRLLPTGPR